MRYLLFNWNLLPEEESTFDPIDLTDEEFEAIAEKYGVIIEDEEEFEAQFNSEFFRTSTHQLRIIKDE